MNLHNFKEDNSFKIVIVPSEKGCVYSERKKSIAPNRSDFFPYE